MTVIFSERLLGEGQGIGVRAVDGRVEFFVYGTNEGRVIHSLNWESAIFVAKTLLTAALEAKAFNER